MACKESGMQRTLTKLRQRLSNGEYYEAHQLYRTLYFRYITQQKYLEAIDLLSDGALALLNAHQISSGADLALLLVSTLEKCAASVSDKNIELVAKLHRLIRSDHIERQTYVVAALQWSRHADSSTTSSAPVDATSSLTSTGTTSSVVPFISGHPKLHAQFAITYWQESDYAQSRYHFVRSTDGEGCAAMLIEYHIVRGFPSEVDLFIAQAVLQFLCLRNKLTAEVCFNKYTTQHPAVEKGPPFVRPLLNFLWMLLIAVDGGNLTVFTILCEQYQLALQRDPSYGDYLCKIGQLFFQLPIPRPAAHGLFGNLLQSLMTFEDDMSDDASDDRALTEPCPVELD
jgi:hypothetical protein